MNTDQTHTLVFVYGTLMLGHSNHRWLDGATFLGHAATERPATLCDVGYFPAITDLAEGPSRVLGQVFAVDDETLAGLDRLEGVPSLYRRELVELFDSEGKTVKAITYVWNSGRDAGPVIASGCWDSHERIKRMSADQDVLFLDD